MGNCIRRESQMQWGGEDWSQVMPTQDKKLAMKIEEKIGINTMQKKEEHHGKSYGVKGSMSTEVKIKITKKQLEKLLKTVEVKQQREKDGLSVEKVLVQLINVGAQFETHQRSGWRPTLQSIPEF